MNYISKWFEMVENFCLGGSVIAVLLIMFSTNADLLLRKLTNHAVFGLYEITQDYLMPAMVFLSISFVYKKGGHVRVTLLEKYFPKGMKVVIDKIFLGLGVSFFVLMTIGGWQAAMDAWADGEVSASSLSYPLAPAYFLVPLGCFLSALRMLISFAVPSSKSKASVH